MTQPKPRRLPLMTKGQARQDIFLTATDRTGSGLYTVLAKGVDAGGGSPDLEIAVQNYALGNALVRALRAFATEPR